MISRTPMARVQTPVIMFVLGYMKVTCLVRGRTTSAPTNASRSFVIFRLPLTLGFTDNGDDYYDAGGFERTLS